MNLNIREEVIEIKKKVGVYLNVGRYDAAEKLLKSTIAEYGPLANIYNLLGTTYHKQSKFPEAIEYFRKAIACNPNYIEANINLSATLCDLSKYEEANSVFNEIKNTIDEKSKQPQMILGKIANSHAETGKLYEESGLFREAIKEYHSAVKLFRPMVDIQLRLANLYLRINNLSEAQRSFEELLQYNPNHAKARAGLGVVQYKMGRKDLASQTWNTAYQNSPNDPTAKAYFSVAQESITN